MKRLITLALLAVVVFATPAAAGEIFTDPERGTVSGTGWDPGTVTIDIVSAPDDNCAGGAASQTVEVTVAPDGTFDTRLGFGGDDCVVATQGEEVQALSQTPYPCEVDNATDEVTVDGTPNPGTAYGHFAELQATAPVTGHTPFNFPNGDFSGTIDDGGTPVDLEFGGLVAEVNEPTPEGARRAICAAAPAPVVDVELNPTEDGYWLATEAGHVAGIGANAPVFDDTNTLLGDGMVATPPAALGPGERVVSMSITPTGLGYWLFTDVGRVIARGDATHFGDIVTLGITLDQPAVDSVSLADGSGYYIVAGDGGIFTFGSAVFLGSVPQILPGVVLDAPVVGLVPNLAGDGYWLIAADGGIFSFGNVGFAGSIPGVLPGVALAAPIIGALASGTAYLMFASDGGIFNFGTSVFHGSLGANANPDAISSVDVLADRSGYVMVDTDAVVVGFGGAFDLSTGRIEP